MAAGIHSRIVQLTEKFVLLFELLIPLVIFIILLLIRKKQPIYYYGISQFESYPLPSAGVLPVLQLFCSRYAGHWKDGHGFNHYSKSETKQFLEKLQAVAENNNFFKPEFTPSQMDDIPRIYQSIIDDPANLRDQFERVNGLNFSSVIQDPNYVRNFLIKNLSLTEDGADTMMHSTINAKEVYRVLFGTNLNSTTIHSLIRLRRSLPSSLDLKTMVKHGGDSAKKLGDVMAKVANVIPDVKGGLIYKMVESGDVKNEEVVLKLIPSLLGLDDSTGDVDPHTMAEFLKMLSLSSFTLHHVSCEPGELLRLLKPNPPYNTSSLSEAQTHLCNLTAPQVDSLSQVLMKQISDQTIIDVELRQAANDTFVAKHTLLLVSKGQRLEEQIIIGTPGTVMDWSIRFKVLDLKKVVVFVLDEADVMIATQGHQDQSIRIQKNLRKDTQMLLFSATYDSEVMRFAQAVVPNPVKIRLRREEESLDNIKQFYIECTSLEDKFRALSNIYGTISIGQSMIFCHTRRIASWLAEKMTKEGHAVGLLSGELTIEQRAAIIRRFQDGKEKVLITTNVSARGIDVEQVTVVVNFDLPVTVDHKPDCETYLHRIGRTGRFGKNGLAINMVDGHGSMQIMKEIERHFGRNIKPLNAEDVDEIEKLST